MLDDLETACPSCGGTVKFGLDDVAKQRTMRCARGHSVKLRDEGGGAASVSRARSDLEKSLKRLNKTINIKF